MADLLPARGCPPFGGSSFHSRVGKAPQKIFSNAVSKAGKQCIGLSNSWISVADRSFSDVQGLFSKVRYQDELRFRTNAQH